MVLETHTVIVGSTYVSSYMEILSLPQGHRAANYIPKYPEPLVFLNEARHSQ